VANIAIIFYKQKICIFFFTALFFFHNKLGADTFPEDYRNIKNTGSISKIEADRPEAMPGDNVMEAMKGRAAGVVVSENGDGEMTVEIRGGNSLNGSNPPLFVVDGVPFPARIISAANAAGFKNPLTGIKSADVEKIEILKDADATAIYGAKGANGVVLITTRKSNESRIRVDADVSAGFSKVMKKIDFLSTEEYLTFRQKALNADGLTPNMTNAYDILLWGNEHHTDWQKELMGNAAEVYNGQLNIAGGNANTKFSIGLGMYQTGVTLFEDSDDKFQRLNGRLSIQHTSPDQRFYLNGSMLYSYVTTENKGFSTQVRAGVTNAPNQPVYDDDGEVYWVPDNPDFSNPARYRHAYAENKISNLIGSFSMGYKFVENLEAKIDLGYSKIYNDEYGYYSNKYLNPYATSQYRDRAFFGNSSADIISAEPQVNYSVLVGDGRLSALLGATWQSQNDVNIYSDLWDFSSEMLFRDPSAAAVIYDVKGGSSEYRYASLFGRLSYDWKSKYVFNGVLRRDGSSRFYRNHRFGNFWSLGTGWIFSREKFFNMPAVNYGKLRASYGSTGNDNVGNYMYLETYTSTTYPYDGVSGLYPDQVANPVFSWEITKKAEAALELGLFGNRLQVTAAAYLNRSNNLITAYPLPGQTGFGSLRSNLSDAVIQNKGVEIELTSTNLSAKDVYWSTSFNVTIPQNRLVSYPGIELSSYSNTYQVGKSLEITRLYRFTGIDRETGMPAVEDVNGDGAIDASADKQFLKDQDYDLYGGLHNSIRYKGFQLDFIFQFAVQPYKLGWLSEYFYPLGYINRNVPKEIADNTWTTDNPDGRYPGLTTTTTSRLGYAYYYYYTESDAVYSDASYVRLKNISLTYTLPAGVLKKMRMNDLKLYVKGQNLLTFSGYDGWDPETANYIPPSQTVIFGAKISF
jgi:TonB-linked SusC/RagA family outer membrane protein